MPSIGSLFYRDANGGTLNSAAASFPVPIPGASVGDPIGIWFTTDASTNTCTAPSGWTLGYATPVVNGFRVFIYKIYAATDGTVVNVPFGQSTNLVWAYLILNGSFHSNFGPMGTITTRGSSLATATALATGSSALPNIVVFHEKAATHATGPTLAPATTSIVNLYSTTAGGASLYIGSYDTAGGVADRTATYSVASTNAAGYQISVLAFVAPSVTAACQSGGVTSTGAQVIYSTSGITTTRIAYSTASDLSSPSYTGTLTADADGMVSATLSGLSPDTVYYYGIEVSGSIYATGRGKLRTFPSAGSQASGTFLFGSCQFTDSGAAVFNTMKSHTTPHNRYGLIHQGDLHYRDWQVNAISAAATIKAQQKSSTQQSNFLELLADSPWSYSWDNHDWGGVGSDATNPASSALLAMYRQMVPHYNLPADTSDLTGCIDQIWTFGRVSFFMLDTRSQRSPSAATDNASKTMLGAGQKARFKSWLASTSYQVKVVLSGIPYRDYGGVGGDRWGAYLTEFAELASYFTASGYGSLFSLTGDIHRNAADDGTNDAYGHVPSAVASAYDQSGAGAGAGWTQGSFPGAGTLTTHNFGQLDITDSGSSITLAYTGYDDSDTANITLSKTYPVQTVVNTASSNIDLELAILTGSGSIQDDRAAVWAGNMPANGYGYSWQAQNSAGSTLGGTPSNQDFEYEKLSKLYPGSYSISDLRRKRDGG